MTLDEATGDVSHFNDWEVVELLGEGSFASVYLCRREGHAKELRAVKFLDKTKLSRMRTFSAKSSGGKMAVTTAMDQVAEEMAIMKTLDHENIGKFC